VAPLDRERALAWLKGSLPGQPTLRYDAYLERPDTYTRLPAMQTHFPLHRLTLDDRAGTEYYVSERSGEAVMKSDRRTRLLGLFGYITHTFFFFRQQSWWSALLQWVSWTGLAMCLTGAVVGVWRYGLSARFRHKGVRSHSPYVGWMKWHHYAGLIFGVLTITWMFSGLVSLDVIPGIRESRYSSRQVAAGALSVQGEGALLDLDSLTVDALRAAATTVARTFVPKELERPDRTFARFDDRTVMRVARDVMPGVAIRDAVWLNQYDDYYYKTISSFDLGLPRMAKTLPVLRVRYDDAAQTWLYLTPSPGQIYKVERQDRANRWGYYGLHGLDFAFLYRSRPLWDIVVVALLVGVTVSSLTSLAPACRRLARQARKLTVPTVRSSRRPVSAINQES
jgi:uncharacterized iron-regulated membrane protein